MNGQMSFDGDEEHDLPPLAAPPHERVRTTDPDASRENAHAVDAKTYAWRCLGFYYAHWRSGAPGGLVYDDMGYLAGFPNGNESYRRRGSDLKRKALIVERKDASDPTGKKIVRRKTRTTGGSAEEYLITTAGIGMWEAGEEAFRKFMSQKG